MFSLDGSPGSDYLEVFNSQGPRRMMIALYPSKKVLKENIGQPLQYVETSFFGPEYKADGSFQVCNRPSLPEGYKAPAGEPKAREFFATVTMSGGVIADVS